jgi:hypothetical protein
LMLGCFTPAAMFAPFRTRRQYAKRRIDIIAGAKRGQISFSSARG